MLGNLSSLPSLSGGGIPSIGGLNQGLAVSGGTSHTMGSYSGLSGSPNPQRSLSLGPESLAFSGAGSMGLSGSTLSYPSSNLSLLGSSGLIQSSLGGQGASSVGRFDQQDQTPPFQQQQPPGTNCQFLQEQVQQQQQLEQQSQGQELRTGLQTQGQKMLGVGVSQLLNQQAIQSLASVKLEQQQAQSMPRLASVRPEQQQIDPVLRQQQIQTLQSLPPVKLEPHQIDQSLHQQLSVPKIEMKNDELQQQVIQQSLLTSHLQRHEVLQLQRQRSQHLQAHMNMQRLLHQQQQQQQLLQTLPHHVQRTQVQQQQLQQHLQQQMMVPTKQLVYENGICARRLMQYMFHQRHRPADNNIGFWRKFVAEFYAPRAKKRWCVSLYGSSGRQPTGVFPQDVWHCEICGSRPGRGFETTVEVLPRLCKIKYDSGILDELLYVDLPREREYRLSSGLMVLEYTKAIQESVFEQLRVVRDGQLRITFTPELKILSWEFCASSHEELLPRRLLVPQVTQLAAVAQKYQNAINQNQSGAAGLSVPELQNNCQMFVASARQLARTLDAPTVNDLGYTKRYVRCLQISEVVNSMKDLIDFSRENGMGPMASLVNFPRLTANLGGQQNQSTQQHDGMGLQATQPDQSMGQTSSMQQSISSSCMNSSISNPSPNINSVGSLPSLLHQNSSTSLQNSVQINVSTSLATSFHTASCGRPSLNSLQSTQANTMNSLQNLHPSVSSQSAPLGSLSSPIQQNPLSSAHAVHILQQSSGQPVQANLHDESNAVHHLLQEMMIPSQLKGGTSFHETGNSVGGNFTVNTGLGSGVGNLLNNLVGSGVSSSGSGTINGNNSLVGSCLGAGGNNGSLGGISSNFSNGMGLLNSFSAGGNGLGNVGINMMMNMGSTNGLGGRLNLSVASQEQSLVMQNPNQGVQHELGGNAMSSGLGSFNDLAFTWKSP